MKILFIGDVVGSPGQRYDSRVFTGIKEKFSPTCNNY